MSRDGEKGKENGATVEDDVPRPFLGTSLIKYMVKSSGVEGGETANVKMSKGAAKLKGFLEQVFRPDVAYGKSESGQTWTKLLKGKSARIIVTMGMPAPVYRWYFGAHGLKNLERNMMRFVSATVLQQFSVKIRISENLI